jgi:hypothetical protein
MNKKSEIVYQGKMFEVVRFEPKPGVTFETAVRAPGTRLLVEYEKSGEFGLLMTRELRHDREGSVWDYRLPGGKVYDTLQDFNNAKENNNDLDTDTLKAAKLEAIQEVGVKDGDFSKINISKAGGSVEWDLHYFLVKDVQLGDQELEDHEQGEIEVTFLSIPEIFNKLKNGEIKEGRSAAVIWDYLAKKDFIKLAV